MKPQLLALGAMMFVAGSLPSAVHGQECLWPDPPHLLMDRPSPPDSTVITIGGMEAKVCYSRPSARGRVIFGELVPYGEPWRTGANEPTLLHLPFTADVAGARLEPGEYLIFTIPELEEWTVRLHTSDAELPNEMMGDNIEVARGTVRAEALDEHVETFTMRGTSGETDAELILEWERTRVRIPIRRVP